MSAIRRAVQDGQMPRRFAGEGYQELVAARLAAHAREAMSENAAAQVRVELALDVTRQAATVRVGRSHLGEHGLRVLRDQLVQHSALGFTASVAGERLSGRAGRSFVNAACEHVRAV